MPKDQPNNRNLYAIVGLQFRPGAKELIDRLEPDAPLYLVREPGNRYDANAVMVFAETPNAVMHVGYIAKDQNRVLSKFIDGNGNTADVLAFDSAERCNALTAAAYGNLVVKAKLHKGGNTIPLAEVV